MARSNRIRPLDAWRAIRALLRNPDDTARVFDVIDALAGNNGDRLLQRLRRSEHGPRLLRERPDLLAALSDRERLLALPEGTLGRCYAEFVTREQISAQGLVDASREGGGDPDPSTTDEQSWLGGRLREMHDLWHVLTGYGRDLIGEASVLAFTHAQTRNRGIGFIVAVAYWRAGGLRGARGTMRRAWRRGRRAEWLPGQDWERLLERPLAELRRELVLGEPETYEALRSEGAPALA